MPPYPHWIACAGWLDLDDVGAHVGDQLPAKRARDQLPELDQSNISQWSGGLRARGHSILLLLLLRERLDE